MRIIRLAVCHMPWTITRVSDLCDRLLLMKEPSHIRRPALLVCDTCYHLPTSHVFVRLERINLSTYDIIYECKKCGTNRTWGKESTLGESKDA